MYHRRSLFGFLALATMSCSSDSGTSAAGSSAEGIPSFSGAPRLDGTSGAGSDMEDSAAPGAGGTGEGAPGAVALNPETPVQGGASAPDATSLDGGLSVSAPPGPNGATAVTPSAGCGNQNPAVGAGSLTIRGAQADYFVRPPSNYSPDTPVPLVFGFHGRNRTHIQFQQDDARGLETELGSRALMVYPKSQGGPGWNFDAEVPPSLEFFDALYARMLETYCVDTSRVFAVGHSSGGYFSIILACRYGNLLRGIGSIAGARRETMCTDERVAGMFIHGVRDTVVANSGGRDARDQLMARNACQATSVPGSVAPCVAYEGCAAGFPVQWCEHEEPEYFVDGVATNHGWPSFASRAVNEFFLSLP